MEVSSYQEKHGYTGDEHFCGFCENWTVLENRDDYGRCPYDKSPLGFDCFKGENCEKFKRVNRSSIKRNANEKRSGIARKAAVESAGSQSKAEFYGAYKQHQKEIQADTSQRQGDSDE